MLAENLKTNHGKHVLLKGDTYNAIIDALVEKSLTQSGYSFSDRQSATSNSSNRRSGYFLFKAEENLLQRSVFGIDSSISQYGTPAIVHALNINAYTKASPFNLFTNIQPYRVTDGYGLCKPIDFYEPTLLSVSDTANIPSVGMPCGPDLNTGGWGVSGKSFGLICISVPSTDVGSDTYNNIWCVRTPDPASIIGTIYGSDVAAYNSTTQTLGQGNIQVQYRNSLGVLVNATGPNGSPLTLPVYNASSSSTFKAGILVRCICVINVGLVIIDQSNLVWGRAKDNIKHFNSGQVAVYAGSPGAEFLDSSKTPYVAFNQTAEVVKDEWCFLTASGDKSIPYYIVNNEYNGSILGKAHNDIKAPNDSIGDQIDIWGGDPGAEISFSTDINSRLKSIFGAITKNSWVIATFLGPDATKDHGGWYISAAQRGLIYTGKVNTGQAGAGTKYVALNSNVSVRLYTGSDGLTDSGLNVNARNLYGPVLELERVQLEWNGDTFIITKAELDCGFEANVLADISKGGQGYVYLNGVVPNSAFDIVIDNLLVTSHLGAVKTGKLVNVFKWLSGFRIVSSEC